MTALGTVCNASKTTTYLSAAERAAATAWAGVMARRYVAKGIPFMTLAAGVHDRFELNVLDAKEIAREAMIAAGYGRKLRAVA